MKRKRLIPFSWWPAAWGMKGATRARAQAEYELEGEELKRALVELDYIDDTMKAVALLDIDFEYNKITSFDRDRAIAKLTMKDKELEIELLEIDFAERKVTDLEYEKQMATLKGESWVHILNVKPDSDTPNHGELELDWNDKFVEELREGGYEGAADEQVVDKWLADLCRNIAMEEFTGIGDFDEKVPGEFIQKTPKSEEGKWEAK